MSRPLLLHTLFEVLGYVGGFAVYAMLRGRRGDGVDDRTRINVLAGAAVGAAIGSRLLFFLCEPARMSLMGKTIVGGLLGGWIGVEIVKKLTNVQSRTGDLFVLPLITAMAIGRIGCFLAGPADHTEGLPTSLPWGIAIGDRVPRHPVALYEIAFLLLLIPLVELVRRKQQPGNAFKVFLASYLVFRLGVDFLKPDPPPLALGLTSIQWACVAALAWHAVAAA